MAMSGESGKGRPVDTTRRDATRIAYMAEVRLFPGRSFYQTCNPWRLVAWAWNFAAGWVDERPVASNIAAAGPAVAVVLVCCVAPLTWMAVAILANPEVRRELALDPFRAQLLLRTIGYNGAAAIIATAMGLPAAFVLGRGRGPFARVLWVVLPAALLLPSLSYAYGWKQVQRIIQPGLRWLGETEFYRPAILAAHFHWAPFHLPVHITFVPNGPADVFRCIWSLGTWLWAVPATLIGLSLRRMDSNVQQQAALDGALLRVTFRQLLGPIVASLAIVTVLATQEFAVYEPTGISVVATEVRMVFDTGALSSADNLIAAPGYIGMGRTSPDQAGRAAAAVATATPLLVVTVLLACLAAWGASRGGAADALATGEWPPLLDASRWPVLATIVLLLLNIGVPVWALAHSLKGNVSLYRILNEFGPQVSGAMVVAVMAATVAIVAAMFFAARWVRGVLAIAGASFLVGGQLLAIALIRIYNRPGLFWAYNGAVVPVIAYVGRFGWLAVAAARGTWSRPWVELRDMASVDGAGRLRTASGVVWPLAWPTLLAGGLIVGALSLTEVPATVLLMPQNPQVLTPTLMTWVHMVRYDAMIEASLLMMGSVLLPAVAAVLLATAGLRVLRSAGAARTDA
jgi:ABC-type Fe3+ transport system permease subunit